jgi:hypothetical protein
MFVLARRGGLKSGETRRLNRVGRIIEEYKWLKQELSR